MMNLNAVSRNLSRSNSVANRFAVIGLLFLLGLMIGPMPGVSVAKAQDSSNTDIGARENSPSSQTSPAPTETSGPIESSQSPSTGLFSIIFSGGPAGIAVMVVLIALSLTALYLVIDQILTLRRSELLPGGLGEEVRQALKENRIEAAAQACQERPSMLSFVLLHGIEELPFGWSSVEKSVEEALAEQSAQLYRRAEYLSVIGNIAPMVGLLGTVMGMIMAFHRVAESQGTASASDLAEGIYQALITTVGGLVIAIPSLGAFAIFRNRLDQIIAEAAYMAQHVFSPLRKRKSAAKAER